MTEANIERQLPDMEERFRALETELTERLSDPEQASSKAVQQLLSEHGRLRQPVELWRQYLKLGDELAEVQQMASADGDQDSEELRTMAAEEATQIQARREQVQAELQKCLAPAGKPIADRDAVLEIRAGTGGEEATIFAADLLRMYARYAARQSWGWEPVRLSQSEAGGCREATVLVGGGCYGQLAGEAGVHRVQRVPKTESQGRVHTSTCTVAVLPQVHSDEEISLPPEDLRIDTYRASGAGGQHVNKTDSAVRVTHLPTGISVECQQDRSQGRNRTTALQILSARLLEARQQEQQREQEQQRREMIGGAKRAEKIRTYNFPQQRITDHRLKKSFYSFNEILDGDLGELLAACSETAETAQ